MNWVGNWKVIVDCWYAFDVPRSYAEIAIVLVPRKCEGVLSKASDLVVIPASYLKVKH